MDLTLVLEYVLVGTCGILSGYGVVKASTLRDVHAMGREELSVRLVHLNRHRLCGNLKVSLRLLLYSVVNGYSCNRYLCRSVVGTGVVDCFAVIAHHTVLVQRRGIVDVDVVLFRSRIGVFVFIDLDPIADGGDDFALAIDANIAHIDGCFVRKRNRLVVIHGWDSVFE